MNSILSPYKIHIHGLKEGITSFDFLIGDDFFFKYENEDVKNANIQICLECNKIINILYLEFKYKGVLKLECDRCLDIFEYPIEFTNNLIVKFSEDKIENNDEIIVLSHDTGELQLGQFLYDSIALQIPLRKVHPEDKNGKLLCNNEVAQRLEDLSINKTEENNIIDPRWAELQKLTN